MVKGLIARLLLSALCLQPLMAEANLNTDRANYRAAREALRKGDFDRYQQLRERLDHYPLAIYLDYYRLFESSRPATVNQAQQFLKQAERSPLARRARGKMLERLAANGDWRDFLTISPQEPKSEALRCYYYRARLGVGEHALAWQGAKQLWLSGKPIDSACDPLFNAWQRAGGRTEADIWARLLLASEEKETGLMRFLAKQLPASATSDADTLIRLHAKPEQLATTNLNAVRNRHADIAVQIAPRWASKEAPAALYWYQRQGQKLLARHGQRAKVEAAIARGLIRQEQQQYYDWVDDTLEQLKDASLSEERARQALRSNDMALLGRTLAQLPPSDKQSARWQFWLGQLATQHNNQPLARQHFAAAAKERDFYGFLAADALGQRYSLNHAAGPLPGREPLRADGGVARAEELLALGEVGLAKSEWQNMLSRLDSAQLEALAEWSLRQNWPQLAIAAASKAEAWDRLHLRFPVLYEETFKRYARNHGLPVNELMAIARRESALWPEAKSSVGARGLMQLMPATAKIVAKQQGLGKITPERLFDVNTNVALGSAYYADLLKDFGGNRLFAIASYNAGPGRIKRWRQGIASAPAWVEAIPFKETRAYVQAVMTYNVIYSELQGKPVKLMTDLERNDRY